MAALTLTEDVNAKRNRVAMSDLENISTNNREQSEST
jgi:hypothetical protein